MALTQVPAGDEQVEQGLSANGQEETVQANQIVEKLLASADDTNHASGQSLHSFVSR
jgi:hypothetical protein